MEVSIDGKKDITDIGGNFRLSFYRKPCDEKVTVIFSSDGYPKLIKIYDPTKLKESQPIQLNPKDLIVKVVNEENKRIENAKIELDGKYIGKTNEWGKDQISIDDDLTCNPDISIRHPQYLPFNENIKIYKNTITVKLIKRKGSIQSFEATILDQCENRIKDVDVSIQAIPGARKKSDKNGVVSIPFQNNNQNVRIQVSFKKPGFKTFTKSYKAIELKFTNKIQLVRSEIKILLLEDGTDKVISLVEVGVNKRYSRTNRKGISTHKFDNKLPCRPSIDISHKGYKPIRNKQVDLSNLPYITIKLQKLDPPPIFEAIILDQCSNRIKDVDVSIKGIQGARKKTDKNGEVKISFQHDDPNATILVSFKKSGYKTISKKEYKLNELKNKKRIKIERREIKIRLVEEGTDKGIPKVQFGVGFGIKNIHSRTDSKGFNTYKFNQTVPCNARINIKHKGYKPIENKQVDLSKLPYTTIELKKLKKDDEPHEECFFNGLVKDQCGNPLNGVKVIITNIPNMNIQTKDNGKFNIPFKCMYKYKLKNIQVLFKKQGYKSKNESYNINDLNSQKTIELTQTQVRVKVMEKGSKKPIQGATVYIYRDNKSETDGRGLCTLDLKENPKCNSPFRVYFGDSKIYTEVNDEFDISKQPVVLYLSRRK